MLRSTVVATTLAAVGNALACRNLGQSCGIQYTACVDGATTQGGDNEFSESGGCGEGLYCDYLKGDNGDCETDGGNDVPDHMYPDYFHEEDCPYVLKDEVTKQMLEDTGCDKTLTSCRVAAQCDADNILGVSDDIVDKDAGESAAAHACINAAKCIEAGSAVSPFAPVYSFRTTNNAKMPSGCSYNPAKRRVVYNVAKGNFGMGTGAGFRAICHGTEAPTHVDPLFMKHDWPITDSDYLLKNDRKCGSDPDPSVKWGQQYIKAEEKWKARMECQAAVEKLDRSDGICGGNPCKPVKIVNWPKYPPYCIVNKSNGRGFWNRSKGRTDGAAFSDYSVICRLDQGIAEEWVHDAKNVDNKVTTRDLIHDFFV